MNKNHQSLALWEKYGEYLLMAMPYADGLISHAQGCTLTDIDGNQLLDLAAGQFCSIVGHNHPKLLAKLTEQMSKVIHVGTQFLSPIVLEAAEKFAQVAPGKLKKSLFLSTGTEANECAISIAKLYTGRTGVVGFSRGYYGLSLATKSLTTIFSGAGKTGDLPRVSETERLMTPYCFRCPVHNHYPECNLSCLEIGMKAAVAASDSIAAVIVEPIVSAGGMIVPPPGYLQALKAFTQQHGALLIIDEAQTGFGRTGKWFAVEHHGVEPDILVVSKSAGGGYPVSGLITTEEIADAITQKGFGHLASHQSDPPAAAAVAAVIDIVREEGLVTAAMENGQYFMNRLRELQSRHAIIKDLRGQGLMIGIEVGYSDRPQEDQNLALPVSMLCRNKGVHLSYTYFEPVLRIIPPLTLTREEIDTAVTALDESLGEAAKDNIRLESILPANRYSRPYIETQRGKRSLKKVFSRLYTSSPEYWLTKLNEIIGK